MTTIYTGYSDNNAELALLTMPNKQEYADRHGYRLVADKIEWERFKVEGLLRIRELLETSDNVLSVGSDVLFMNHRMTLESLIQDDRAVLSKESIGFWPINNDVMLWQNNAKCRKLLDRIIADAPTWLRGSWLWQAHLWDLIVTEPEIEASVRLCEPRELQSVHQQGLGKWQLGDRIIHFLNYSNDVKMMLAEMYLPFAGEPTTAVLNRAAESQIFVNESFDCEQNWTGPEGLPLWRRVQCGEVEKEQLAA